MRCEHCGSIVLTGQQGLSPTQTCEVLNISMSQLYVQLLHKGVVDSYKVGHLRFITVESIQRVVDARASLVK